ncbi:MAG TPA: hypothetical protein PLY69_09895, partial [Bacteroidales bacterium]|nr:hypothetical protein [Bacteroidales bacterium]
DFQRMMKLPNVGQSITPNGKALAKGRNRSTKISALHQRLIGLQMLNFNRLPAFCQCNVMGSTVSNTRF